MKMKKVFETIFPFIEISNLLLKRSFIALDIKKVFSLSFL